MKNVIVWIFKIDDKNLKGAPCSVCDSEKGHEPRPLPSGV